MARVEFRGSTYLDYLFWIIDSCIASSCPMTTAMDSHIGLQNSVQNPPLEQAQHNHPPDDNTSPAPATVSEIQRPDTNDVDANARKKLQNEQLRVLRSVYILLDLLSPTNARCSS
jgi:hypothetical protein